MNLLHVSQMAFRLPVAAFVAVYSTMPSAGAFGARHLRQYICPGWQGRLAAFFRLPHHCWNSLPRISVGFAPSIAGKPFLIQLRTVCL